MRKCLTLIVVVVSFFFSCWHARADAPFTYRNRGKKDPFIPLVSADGKLMVTYSGVKSVNDIVLEGIIYDPDRGSIVILNGSILKEDDQMGSIKVKRIEESRVILIFENEEHILKLKE